VGVVSKYIVANGTIFQ